MNATDISIDLSSLFSAVAKGIYFYNPYTGAVTSKLTGYMHGTKVGAERRYTLKRADGAWSRTIAVNLSDIKRAATHWCEAQRKLDVAVAKSTKASVAVKGWIIGSTDGNGGFSIAPRPVVHVDINKVNAELERLAKNHPGKTFVKFRIENFAKSGGVQIF